MHHRARCQRSAHRRGRSWCPMPVPGRGPPAPLQCARPPSAGAREIAPIVAWLASGRGAPCQLQAPPEYWLSSAPSVLRMPGLLGLSQSAQKDPVTRAAAASRRCRAVRCVSLHHSSGGGQPLRQEVGTLTLLHACTHKAWLHRPCKRVTRAPNSMLRTESITLSHFINLLLRVAPAHASAASNPQPQ